PEASVVTALWYSGQPNPSLALSAEDSAQVRLLLQNLALVPDPQWDHASRVPDSFLIQMADDSSRIELRGGILAIVAPDGSRSFYDDGDNLTQFLKAMFPEAPVV